MGRFTVLIEMANHEDQTRARFGDIAESDIRSCEMEAWPDSGATPVVVPASVAESLGLPSLGQNRVRFADNRRETRERYGDLWLRVAGRDGVFPCVAEPGREDVLLGAIVMEQLDLLIDCQTGDLIPRDPEMIVQEIC